MSTVIAQGPGALAEYYQWFDRALPGEVAIYWIGDLQFDRDLRNFPGAPDDESEQRTKLKQRVSALDVLAKRVFDDAKDGHLTLIQRKVDTSCYQYLAIMKRKPDGHSSRHAKHRVRESVADA